MKELIKQRLVALQEEHDALILKLQSSELWLALFANDAQQAALQSVLDAAALPTPAEQPAAIPAEEGGDTDAA